jgi:hypothetical protein
MKTVRSTIIMTSLALVWKSAVSAVVVVPPEEGQWLETNGTADRHRHRRHLNVVESNLPNRVQWDCNFRSTNCCNEDETSGCSAICDGYCGEVTLQEILLYYGAYVSQGLIRRMVETNDGSGAIEILIESGEPDIVTTAQLLGLQPGESKYYVDVNDFIPWVQTQLQDLDTPVVMGVQFRGDAYIDDMSHIVTAIGMADENDGIRFNDHYAMKGTSLVATLSTVPEEGVECQSDYCLVQYMYGISMKPPLSVPMANLVRLQGIAESSLYTEPNWTCSSAKAVTHVFQASAAYPNLLDTSTSWYVAVTFRGTTSQEIRNKQQGALHSDVVECHALSTPSASVMISVPSNGAVYTKIVDASVCENVLIDADPATAPPVEKNGGTTECATATVQFTADEFPQDNDFYLEDRVTSNLVWDELFFQPQEVMELSACIDPTGCHVFEFYDSEGNGYVRDFNLDRVHLIYTIW